MADTEKKAEKAAAKEAKKQVKNSAPKDHWFTISGIRKEAKRVRWPHWKSSGNNPGILEHTGEVLGFTVSFALFFVVCELIVTYLLKFIGIGA